MSGDDEQLTMTGRRLSIRSSAESIPIGPDGTPMSQTEELVGNVTPMDQAGEPAGNMGAAAQAGGPAGDVFKPPVKQNLSERLSRGIRTMIQQGAYNEGDRLPSIMEMARSFGVGHPTVREALKKLEAMGIVEIRHGSGVYVTRRHDVLVLATRDYQGTVTKKLLIDLIQARTPLEIHSVMHAARNAAEENLAEMRRLLATAAANLDDQAVRNSVNTAFHREIAIAAGNTVLKQLLEVVGELFGKEQDLIFRIFGSPQLDYEEHLSVLDALEKRDEILAVERMRAHLERVEAAIHSWDPQHYPVG